MPAQSQEQDELDLIGTLLRFVNEVDESWTQQQIYELYLPLRYVKKTPRPDGNFDVAFQGIPEAEGIRPFLNDRLFLHGVLTAVIKKNTPELQKLRAQFLGTLQRTLTLEVVPA